MHTNNNNASRTTYMKKKYMENYALLSTAVVVESRQELGGSSCWGPNGQLVEPEEEIALPRGTNTQEHKDVPSFGAHLE